MSHVNVFRLTKSPLVEVSLYMECFCRKEGPDVDCRAIQQALAKQYPNFRVIAQNNPRGKGPVILAEAVEEKKALLLRPSGYSFSMTQTYSDWNCFVVSALETFPLFIDKFGLDKVVRVGVRSVNKFPVMAEVKTAHDVFATVVEEQNIGTRIPIDFLLKETHYYNDYDLYGTTVLAARTLKSNEVRASMDVDVFALNLNGINPEDFTNKLDSIRVLKDVLFFSMVRPNILKELR